MRISQKDFITLEVRSINFRELTEGERHKLLRILKIKVMYALADESRAIRSKRCDSRSHLRRLAFVSFPKRN